MLTPHTFRTLGGGLPLLYFLEGGDPKGSTTESSEKLLMSPVKGSLRCPCFIAPFVSIFAIPGNLFPMKVDLTTF